MNFYCGIKYTLIIWMFFSLCLFSQTENLFQEFNFENIFLDEVVLESDRILNNKIHFLSLRKKVYKVYPYVDSIKQILDEANLNLETINKKRHSRRYARKFQKQIIDRFGKDVTGLTRSEGVILSKLIYREFDETVYDLITQYRGSLHSFFWQRVAKLYDGDLKVEFNPEDSAEDFFIDVILNQSF